MNPVEITQGKSFKGLSQYLLNDQREDEAQSVQTSNRVGWTQTYNLADADPDKAWRLMLATANSADALKEAAGIKRGRKVKNTVYHYSLNFHPEDEVTEDVARKAVAESLATLGMQDHQALAVEHTDTDHRHIHVMVNLIDPQNGMSAATPILGDDGKKRSKLSNSQRRLSQWAGKFERDNGLKITEGRLSNANKRSRGEDVQAKRKSRNVYEREKMEKSSERRQLITKKLQENRAKEIQAQSDELKEKSSLEWDALKESYAAEKDAIKAHMSPAFKSRRDEIKELFKPYWAKMFRRHDAEKRAFENGDVTAIGKIWHGMAVFRDRALDGDYLGGFVAAFSAEARRNIVLKKHDRERAEMGRKQEAQFQLESGKIKADFDRQFSEARERFLARCKELKSTQDESWQAIRQAWREYNQDRNAAYSQARSRQADISRKQGKGLGFRQRPS